MASDLVQAFEAISQRLIALAAEDEKFRSSLHELALAIMKATEPVVDQLTPSPEIEAAAEQIEAATAEITGEVVVASESIDEFALEDFGDFAEEPPETTTGLSTDPVVQRYARYASVSADIHLPLVESRCRLKAEAARWAADRRRLISQGAEFRIEIAPKDGELITKARGIPDCFLWMCHPSCPSPSDLSLFENVASSFENAAELLDLIRQIEDKPELLQAEFEQCLDLLAEAQSALRVSIEQLGGKSDTDQLMIFQWIRLVANENQIFIQHFMRQDDPADPTQWSALAARIGAVDAQIQATLKKQKQRTKLLGAIRYKSSQIHKSESGEGDWEGIVQSIDELISSGVPPSNVELRDVLVPLIDSFPEILELPKNVSLVFREIDRYLETVPPPTNKSPMVRSQEVQEIAGLLRGRTMVVIGGKRRPGSYEALKEAFELNELHWIETREHESINGFEPYIARPDVAVVILAIRWSSHSHGDAQIFCEKHGKPFVRLPSGYNPNQVAAQILAQCSDRLRREG